MPRPTEQDLQHWIRAQQGRLWRYLRLLGAAPGEAEDLVQDAFVRLLERRAGESLQALQPLLRTVARNLWIDRRRREGHRARVAPHVAWSEAVDQWLADRAHAGSDPLADERIDLLRQCLAELTPRARDALRAHHLDGRPLADLAPALGMKLEGVRALLQRARARVRACVSRRDPAASRLRVAMPFAEHPPCPRPAHR